MYITVYWHWSKGAPIVKNQIDKGLRRNWLDAFHHETHRNVARALVDPPAPREAGLHASNTSMGTVGMVPEPCGDPQGMALSDMSAIVALFAARAR